MTPKLRRWLRPIGILVLLGVMATVGMFWVHAQYSLWLAERVMDIPDDATDVAAHYFGFVQSRTLFVRFSVPAGDEEALVSQFCESQYIDEHPFQYESSSWLDPSWWTPPRNPESYLGGSCANAISYLIDTSDSDTSTVFIVHSP